MPMQNLFHFQSEILHDLRYNIINFHFSKPTLTPSPENSTRDNHLIKKQSALNFPFVLHLNSLQWIPSQYKF